MSIKKSNIKILAAVLTAVLCLPSCLDLDEGRNDGVGYMELQGLAADVEVYELVPTRSGTVTLSELGVTEYNEPEIGKITFTLTGPMNHSWKGALTEALALTVGKYTLTGTYDNSGNDGLAEALYGEFSTSFDVSAQQTVTPVIKLPLVNSLVKVTMASGFAQHFNPADGACVTFTVEKSSEEKSSESAAVGNYVFVPASSALKVEVRGTNSAGVGKTLSYDLTSPAEKTAYNIVCGMTTGNVPSVTLAQDFSAGAFEDVLYFPAATVANINTDVAAGGSELVYEIKGGSNTDWREVTVGEITANGNTYKCINGLTSGTTYSLRARVGNIFSNGKPEGVSFTQVDFDDCVSVVASAGHTKDGNGDLDGTEVTASVSVTNLPSIIKELATVTATEGTFKNSAETTRSTAAVTTLSKDGQTSLEMQNPDGWPYIPQGENHTMTVNVTCKIGEKTYTTTSSKGNITVPAPEFSVNVSGYTTYDKYDEYKQGKAQLSEANVEGKAEYIFQISSSVGISETLLKNNNYDTKVYYTCGPYTDIEYDFVNGKDDINTSEKIHNIGDLGGFPWGSNTLVAKVKFAGTEIIASKTCHITGLPYDLSKAPQTDKWTLSGGEAEWDNNYIHLDHATENSATLKLSVIGSINVSLKTSFSIYTPTRFGSPSLTISAGGNEISKTTGASGTAKTTNYNDVTCDGSLSSTNPTIKFNRTYFAGREGEVYIKALLITYR